MGRKRDALTGASAWGAAIVVLLSFVFLAGDLSWHGAGRLSIAFIVESPSDAGRSGGLFSILISTLLILGVCSVVSMPIGVGAALFLSETSRSTGLFGRFARRSLDVLAGMPSIVFGLFGNAFFCKLLGLGFSILSGGLTLACMVLPILIRSTEAGLRMVPAEHRMGAAALGLSRTGTLVHVILPAAAPGLLVGFVLGIGRAIAETAALIFTSGYVDRVPGSLLDSGRALSVHIYDLSMNVPGGDASAYAAALVLMVLLLGINGLASLMSDRLLGRTA